MFPLPAAIVAIIEIAGPAMLGALAGALLGHKNVRVLRTKTGDDSVLTNVLSGEVFRSRKDEPRKAA